MAASRGHRDARITHLVSPSRQARAQRARKKPARRRRGSSAARTDPSCTARCSAKRQHSSCSRFSGDGSEPLRSHRRLCSNPRHRCHRLRPRTSGRLCRRGASAWTTSAQRNARTSRPLARSRQHRARQRRRRALSCSMGSRLPPFLHHHQLQPLLLHPSQARQQVAPCLALKHVHVGRQRAASLPWGLAQQ